ncbi:TSUP family transporter, partial [Desulfoprunum benzoelyticum]
PYGELRFSGQHHQPVYAHTGGRSIMLGSFSKITVPGFRLGWMVAPPEIIRLAVKAKQAAQAFEAAVKAQKTGGGPAPTGVKILGITVSKVQFTFCGVEFSFNPVLPVVGGVVISALAAFLGVGGGFLLVPFLTSITQLPMYLAAGTSALAVLVSMITSI